MGKGYVIFLAIFAATGSFLFGYDSGVMSNVIASENFLEYFDTDPDSDIIGALNSTFSGGAAIGALIAGELSDILGRKYTIQIGATIATVGAVLQFAAVKIVMLLVGRIISGFAIGVLSMVIPVYQTECSHPKSRGLIVGIAQQMIGAGWIISTWTGFGSGYAHGQFQWRFPLSVQALPSIILMFGMFIFPESPRHLIKQGQYDTGKAVLRKLHYDGTNDDWIEQEYTEIKDSYCAESELTVNPWRAMFVIPQWRRRLLIATGMHAFGQSTGINAIGYYQTIMYRDLGLTGHMIPLMACFYNLVGPSTCFRHYGTLSAEGLIEGYGKTRPDGVPADADADAELVARITAIKGLGKWTAEMFATFALGRCDVFSTGDVGVEKAMATMEGWRRGDKPLQWPLVTDVRQSTTTMTTMTGDSGVKKVKAKTSVKAKWRYMSPQQMLHIAEQYRPWRAVFMWYMWKVTDTEVAFMMDGKGGGGEAQGNKGKASPKKGKGSSSITAN
ncbi:hypothetical protein KEM55_007208 [Ascosphaera atra]|nr:hypothetical protein KEM55_007208 [Ascosphaera atra]